MTARRILLALQGGGSHGAFTWGVLDRLLEEADFEIEGITGTSAGAMNAVVLAHGLIRGGAGEARRALRDFWEAVGRIPGLGTVSPGSWHLDRSPVYIWFDLISRVLSPYQLNPLNFHPLRSLIADSIDFAGLRSSSKVQVIICATNVHTGRRRIFENRELSVDAVLASACLPFLFPAVEIDGEPYWDGGYTGNPAIAPLIRSTTADDLFLVTINPLVRKETPRSARAIIDRATEISFNSTFWLELTAIAAFAKFRSDGVIDPSGFRRNFFHRIDAEERMSTLGASSKMNNHPDFLKTLFEIGRAAAGDWLDTHRSAVGLRSTVDLSRLLPIDLQD
jgi:NTE family protein